MSIMLNSSNKLRPQRVNVAKVIALKLKLIVLDEPVRERILIYSNLILSFSSLPTFTIHLGKIVPSIKSNYGSGDVP